MANESPSGERDFAGRGMARIFGAPISWVALFGALMGALSIVPMIFYPFGGGFASAGMVVFGPLSGVILGPWAGAIAGIIGGLIGMFISPASYPLGIVDVFLSGAFLPLAWGLSHPRYRKIFIPVFIIAFLLHLVIPYIWPGPAGGFDAINIGSYLLSFIWVRCVPGRSEALLKSDEHTQHPKAAVVHHSLYVCSINFMDQPMAVGIFHVPALSS
jgi:hypothetical protein